MEAKEILEQEKFEDARFSPEQLFSKLERRIKYVRRARIESSKRLKEEYRSNQRTVHIFTFIVVFLSIWYTYKAATEGSDLESELYGTIGVLVLNFSVYTTLITLYLNSKNPAERIFKFQANYMELTRLLGDIQGYRSFVEIQKYSQEKYDEFADRYASLLAQSENHEDVDYWKSFVQYASSDKGDSKITVGDIRYQSLKIYEKNIKNYHNIFLLKKFLMSISPGLLLLLLLFINYLGKFFN